MNGDLLYQSKEHKLDILNQVLYIKEVDRIFVSSRNQKVHSLRIEPALGMLITVKIANFQPIRNMKKYQNLHF